MNYPKLDFSYNWNNKLHCECFTTLRLRNDAKYKIGNILIIEAAGINSYPVKVLDAKHYFLHQLTEGMCRIDTGYSKAETIALIQRMYKNKPINWDVQQMTWVLLQRLKEVDVANQEKMF